MADSGPVAGTQHEAQGLSAIEGKARKAVALVLPGLVAHGEAWFPRHGSPNPPTKTQVIFYGVHPPGGTVNWYFWIWIKIIYNGQGENSACGWITADLGLPSAVCAHRCSVKMKNTCDVIYSLLICLFDYFLTITTYCSSYRTTGNLLLDVKDNTEEENVTWTSSFYVIMYEIRVTIIWLFWAYMVGRSYYVFQ